MDLAALAGIAGGAVVVGGALIGSGRWVARRVRGLGEFLEDWKGVPARPGFPARPGVPARLEQIERRVAGIETELHPNSGSTLRDAVTRIEGCVSSEGGS